MQPTHFEQELSGLKQSLLAMASRAEAAVTEAVRSLLQRDMQAARAIVENDSVIDTFEIDIDRVAVELLAKAPLATDLRLITVVMKICRELERVGDEASKIAKRSIDLCQVAPLKQFQQLPGISEAALRMLRDALHGFVRLDPVAARAIIPEDKALDAMNRELTAELTALMMSDSQSVPAALNLMVISKSLERVGDHAKNIAEETVFLCEAHDIRHPGANPAERP